MTHTVATLGVSQRVFDEIADKLRAGGYTHLFMTDGTIDMYGIALARELKAKAPFCTCGVAYPPHRCEVHSE